MALPVVQVVKNQVNSTAILMNAIVGVLSMRKAAGGVSTVVVVLTVGDASGTTTEGEAWGLSHARSL